jgi:hypothetical protein
LATCNLAVAAAQVVGVTVPFEAQEATFRGLAGAVGERVVISTAVPLRYVEGIGPTHVDVAEGSASQQVAALLPHARVVGALHTVMQGVRIVDLPDELALPPEAAESP